MLTTQSIQEAVATEYCHPAGLRPHPQPHPKVGAEPRKTTLAPSVTPARGPSALSGTGLQDPERLCFPRRQGEKPQAEGLASVSLPRGLQEVLGDRTALHHEGWLRAYTGSLGPATTGHLPQADGQQVREQQGRQEDFEKLGREHAPLLHDTRVPHAEGGCALRVLEQERPAGGRGRVRAPACSVVTPDVT